MAKIGDELTVKIDGSGIKKIANTIMRENYISIATTLMKISKGDAVKEMTGKEALEYAAILIREVDFAPKV